LNGTNIDLQLVKEGLAVARVEDSSYASQFVEAEIYARENKIGCKWENLSASSYAA
jgi:endonuclease YncB( thermonuclease family)